MIVYDGLWTTLKRKGISQYQLISQYKISAGQLDRLRKHANISTFTLNNLCRILEGRLEDIAEYREDTE